MMGGYIYSFLGATVAFVSLFLGLKFRSYLEFVKVLCSNP